MRQPTLVMVTLVAAWLPACADACESLASLDWVLGEWTSVDDVNPTRESWRRISTDTFEGVGSARSPGTGGMIVTETLRLVSMSGGVYYIAKVAHNDLPVAFAATACEDGSATFENPAHDFPKRLVYRLEDPDRMTVAVGSDGENGFTIRFIRAADNP